MVLRTSSTFVSVKTSLVQISSGWKLQTTTLLGENQDTGKKRIASHKKGYLLGSPDLIINNLHKHYTGFAIEFKNPNRIGVLSYDQSKMLRQYENNGLKTLVSNDYGPYN